MGKQMWRAGLGVAAVVLVMSGLACSRGSAPATPAAPTTSPAGLVEPPAASLRPGEQFLRLRMAQAYTPSPPHGGTDDYRCFLIDPHLTQQVYVTGSQFMPQNGQIVHHAIFFRVDPDNVAPAQRLDADSPGDGWTCFGGTRISGPGPGGQLNAGAAWIAAWAPGGKEAVLGNQTGYLLQPGSQFVMQVHYNLLATKGKATGTDQSGIRLRLMSGTAKLTPLHTTLVPAPVELPCAPTESGPLCDRDAAVLDVMARFGSMAGATVAGLNLLCNAGKAAAPGPTQHCDVRVREAGTVYAVAGHMHLLGRSITVQLNPGTPGARTLLDVPVYNFDDQGAKPLAKPVTVKPGDTLRVTCTHDAGLRRLLPELSSLPARYVVWGDGTSDEMCLGIVIWAAR
jgi:Copper type II ascorbate-dependent monooxygenase, C-terminal domain